jgi:hypothetical protein
MKWIDINKRLPKSNKIVFVLIKQGIPSIAKFSEYCFTEDGLEVEDVTHWMSIPELPKKGKEVFKLSNYY